MTFKELANKILIETVVCGPGPVAARIALGALIGALEAARRTGSGFPGSVHTPPPPKK